VHGDPRNEDTFIGPMISEGEAKRLHGWIEAARAAGATILCGGQREGAMLRATLIEGADSTLDVACQEAFGPVALIEPFDDFDAALERVDDSMFGLQAGIFTDSMSRAMHAWDVLDVGGVVIGDVPSWRVDNMPYGGVKDSGLGREGVRYAIEDMTEIRLLVVKDP
jgi:acyl-CoA reductase-like NAD-dependent aldehyde dehydrogenase